MDNLDLSNKDLLKILKDKSPAFLADAFRKDNNLESCIELLKKTHKKDKSIDQLCLTYIYFNKFKEALKYSKNPKLKITLNLHQNIAKIKDLTVKKYLLIQEKVFKKMFKDFKFVKFILIGIRLNEEIEINELRELGEGFEEEIKELENGFEEDDENKEIEENKEIKDIKEIKDLDFSLSDSQSSSVSSSGFSSLPSSQSSSLPSSPPYSLPPSPSPSSPPSPSSSLFKVYNYKCSSLDYQNILSSILEYLLNHFDLNLIFIYYQIATLSCFLNNCKLNCREVAHETIKRELLDLSYLKILGYKNLVILYEMYKEEMILGIMNEINPFLEEKYKIKKKVKKVKITLNEEIPIEETVLIKEIKKPNGIVKKI